MARVNYNRQQREDTTNSLYRGRTPDSMNITTSDKENSSPRIGKRKSTTQPSTRSSQGLAVQNTQGSKRRRMENNNTLNSRLQEQLSQYPRQEETEEQRFFNPDQNEDLRRDLRMGMRDNRAELIGMYIYSSS
jgi:hypothetical protein